MLERFPEFVDLVVIETVAPCPTHASGGGPDCPNGASVAAPASARQTRWVMERISQPRTDDEVELLLGWLHFHRGALAAKCEGMTDQQLLTQSSSPSSLTLLGLIRHLTEMENHYLTHALTGVDRGYVYCTEDDDEADIEHLDVSMVSGSMRKWEEVVAEADDLLTAHRDLSSPVAAGWGSVRWHLVKVIQEYARHNGHADIIRERIDGLRGE